MVHVFVKAEICYMEVCYIEGSLHMDLKHGTSKDAKQFFKNNIKSKTDCCFLFSVFISLWKTANNWISLYSVATGGGKW